MRSSYISNIVLFLDKILAFIEIPIMIVTASGIIGLLTYSALGRYVLHVGVIFEDELARTLYLWLSMISASYVIRTSDHINVGILLERIVKRNDLLGKAYQILVYSINIAFLLTMFYIFLYRLPEYVGVRTLLLRMPVICFYAAAAVGVLFMSLRYLTRILMIFAK